MFVLRKSVLLISIGSGLVALLLVGSLPRGATPAVRRQIPSRHENSPSTATPEKSAPLMLRASSAGSFRSPAKPRSEESAGALIDADQINTEHRDCELAYDMTLDDLEKRVDAIVVGRPTQHLREREHHPEWTRGPFVVERVLSQKGGTDLAAGGTISVAEPVGFVRYNGNPTRLITDFCFETKKNSRYVLFISRGTDGTYGTHNYRLGQFNTDGTDCEDRQYPDAEKQSLRDEIQGRYSVAFADSPPCRKPQ